MNNYDPDNHDLLRWQADGIFICVNHHLRNVIVNQDPYLDLEDSSQVFPTNWFVYYSSDRLA